MPTNPLESTGGTEPCPSTLVVPWTAEHPPLEEEVRAGLRGGIGELRFGEGMEAAGSVLWNAICRMPDSPTDIHLWVDLVELPPRATRPGPGPGIGTQRELSSALWGVFVETWLDDRRPLHAYHAQLQVAWHLGTSGHGGVFDTNSQLGFSPEEIDALCSARHAPRSRYLYGLEARGESVVTRGLNRIGLPDLLCPLHPEAAWQTRTQIDVIVEALIDGETPDSEGKLHLGPGNSIRLEAGDQSPLCSVILEEGRKSGSPQLAAFSSSAEIERRAGLAQERWGVFGQIFFARRPEGWRFHAQILEELDSPPPHRWWDVLDLRPGALKGGSGGDAPRWIDLPRVCDWLIVSPEGAWDPELSPLLLHDLDHPSKEI